MKTYNGIIVPKRIPTNRIMSAFQNEMYPDKLEEYTNIYRELMLSHSFPPIMGYPTIIDEDDIGREFLSGEEITEEHIGMMAWKVTDGHHRAVSATKVNIPYLEVELDYSTITSAVDMQNFKEAMKQ